MRRLAAIAGCLVLALVAGCAALGTRPDRPTPEQRQRRQQWSEAAQEAIDRGDWTTARGLLEQLVAEAPRSAEAHHRLGRVFEAQGQLDAAEWSYHRALEIEPEYADALCGLGRLEARSGRLDAALEHIRGSIEIAPNQVEAHFHEGQVLEALGRTDEALAAYFRALAVDPTSSAALLRVAAIQLDRQQNDQALARLTRVLELAPGEPEALLCRGRAHLALGHVNEAVNDLGLAAEKLGDRPDVHYHRALALEQARQPEAAREAAQRALALAPADAQVRNLAERLRR
jgi:tetratricopeptide (TPR) repeat protein